MIKVSQLLKTVPTADGDLTILRGVDLEIVAGTSARLSVLPVPVSLPCWDCSRAWTWLPRGRCGSTE
ncbi:MAG: hypothetical protein CM15mP125_1800 [Gammaproteobacteria bacterium]|nr:MAG: hypothetical protein CM15mP125_1800 [Gammaproteobacteria bacterium]